MKRAEVLRDVTYAEWRFDCCATSHFVKVLNTDVKR
jgi:hypothetical protein